MNKQNYSKSFFRSSCCLFLLLTAGCGPLLATDYNRPDMNIPHQWSHAPANADSKIGSSFASWWQQFDDPTLEALVDEALEINNDLALATLRVKESRIKADLAFDQYPPYVSASTRTTNARSLRDKNRITRTYSATADASFEIDLWGKIASESASAEWEAMATDLDRQSTKISLIGTTANLYWKIAYLNERIALSQESLDYLGKMLDLVNIKHKAGAASAIDVSLAAQNLASQEANHTQLIQQRTEASNAFDVLFNGPPETLKAKTAKLPSITIPDLPENTPASVLENRPDIQAAESRLRKSLSDVDATRTSFLPKITLTGSVGSSSIALTKILTDPIATLGTGIVLPFLSWFDMRNTILVSETQYEEAVVSFRQTVFNALADVENALSSRARNRERGLKLAEAEKLAQKNESLYAIQYEAGYAPLQTLLDSREKSRTAKIAVLENTYAQLSDFITLYKALGGGTQPSTSNEDEPAATPNDGMDITS